VIYHNIVNIIIINIDEESIIYYFILGLHVELCMCYSFERTNWFVWFV